VCKDGSCSKSLACGGATIPYVVGPSCTGGFSSSCQGANIGSVDSSCNDEFSCQGARLSGVDLINSCNASYGCYKANGDGEITELEDCCNERRQCYQKRGTAINAYCVSYCELCTYCFCLPFCQMTHSSLIHNHKYI